MNAILERIPDEQIELARHVDQLALAERYTQLRRASTGECAGPCPRCGGTDRFHVTAEWFFCRQCHEKRGDAIGFVQWLTPGLSFPEAVVQLTGGTLPVVAVRRPERLRQPAQPVEWRKRAEAIATEAQMRLWMAAGKPGQAYLEGRALEPQTWMQYGLGYRADAPLPGTQGTQHAPAIMIPWRAGGR